ncbi:MAG: ammonia channel protein [Nitrospiraceae bacterium]|nr:ammonia channel protein [Nitrospiraceae bacterium]
MPHILTTPLVVVVGLFWATGAWAQESKIDTGDTAWIIVATALVFAMVLPGVAFFYGGLVRSKNVLGMLIQTGAIMCVISIVWVFWGYSLAFGPDKGGIIGGLDFVALSGVGSEPGALAPTIPHQLFMVFQLMFAAITVALITGAFAERMKFTALLLFAVLWSTLIYSPLAHWVWGGGWLHALGGLDFAGGAVVHISSGFAALACALVLGKRKGYGTENMPPHNLPFAFLGAGMLWFGWFGFNAGSALGANEVAVTAFVNTHLAASAGAISWMVAEWVHRGKPTLLGVASGMIAGLATITPAAGYVTAIPSVFIGLIGGVVCYLGVVLKLKLGYDESLDVLAIHGFGGITGLLAVGLLATEGSVSAQLVMIGVAVAFCFIGTYVILKIVDRVIGLRVSLEEEQEGLDLSQHRERAYS